MGEALPPVLAFKLAKLIPLLSSDNDGEALATVRAIGRTLEAGGADFHALAKSVAEPKMPIVYRSEAKPAAARRPTTLLEIPGWCRTHHGGRLSPSEERFIADMLGRLSLRCRASEKQEKWLRSIYYRLGGEYVP
jgi:hypothetical protein